MVLTRYGLEDFVGDMETLVASSPSQEQLFDRGSTYLERLISNQDLLPDAYRQPSGRGKTPLIGVYNLHRGNGVYVSALVWGPGSHMPPHDHNTWGMIGVMDNGIQETRFRRVDDRQRDDFAQLERDRVANVRAGEISLLVPVVDEIHQMDNLTDRPTVEIHVYGNDLVGLPRCIYNLETGAIKHFKSGPSDNC
jgi:predicted metal-dependent enzyme (double-stranded beta helix superfamily)